MLARVLRSPAARAGRITLMAASTIFGAACGKGSVTSPSDSTPRYSIHLLSGDDQSAQVGTQLKTPVVLQVVDYKSAQPVAGVNVELNVSLDNGALTTPTTLTTDAQGQVSFVWQLGAKVRTDSLLVTIPSDDFTAAAVVEAFATAGAPAQIVVLGGDGQKALPGAQLPSAIRLEVEDAQGNPVSGVTVAFTDDDGGTFVTPNIVTDDGGIAAEQLVLPSTPGTDDVTASVTLGDGTVLQVTLHESAAQ